MTVERRKNVRFKVQEGVFACLSLQYNIAGKILNISKSGLAFGYIANQKRTDESHKLDISFTDGSFRSGLIPFKTVWDYPMRDDFSFGSISIRHCGVNFVNLRDGEKADLEFIIQNCTRVDTEA